MWGGVGRGRIGEGCRGTEGREVVGWIRVRGWGGAVEGERKGRG